MKTTYKQFTNPVESNRFMIELHEVRLYEYIGYFEKYNGAYAESIIELYDDIKRRKLIDNINKLECINETRI